MHITTKAVFEWDKDLQKYVEVHNEGYEYEGELEKALEWWEEPDEVFDESPSAPLSPPGGDLAVSPAQPPVQEQFGTVDSLGYGDILKGSKWETGWQKFFDPYDPTKERMLGQEYQTQLGSLFGEAGLGTQNLLQSWAGGGNVMTGGKRRQRRALGKQTALGGTRLLSGLEQDRFGQRESWKREQRSTLNTLLGSDIWGSDDSGGEVEVTGTMTATGGPVPGSLPHLDITSQIDYTNPGIDFNPDSLNETWQSSCEAGGGTWDPNAGVIGECSNW